MNKIDIINEIKKLNLEDRLELQLEIQEINAIESKEIQNNKMTLVDMSNYIEEQLGERFQNTHFNSGDIDSNSF